MIGWHWKPSGVSIGARPYLRGRTLLGAHYDRRPLDEQLDATAKLTTATTSARPSALARNSPDADRGADSRSTGILP
jgi:hypothetical protein